MRYEQKRDIVAPISGVFFHCLAIGLKLTTIVSIAYAFAIWTGEFSLQVRLPQIFYFSINLLAPLA